MRGRFWLILFALILACGVAVYRSPLLRAGEIQVSGVNRLTQERVAEAAGLTAGSPRWEHSAVTIASALEQEPRVAQADVVWDWGRVRISVAEREPVGLVRYSDRYYLELDETGRILGQSELVVGNALPVISGPAPISGAVRGQRIEHQGLMDALTVLWAMAPELRGQISEVQVGTDNGLTWFMAGGAVVRWGQVPAGSERLAGLDTKLKFFLGVWNDLPRKRSGCRLDFRVDGKSSSEGCE